ncbi:citrate synthase-lysine N-methyltransferase CSKMT, mitochondrial [Patella vulgata]|uniref:citrate synthase-lysine N-methyltransferase CSKMT, mitochondrial n=1 Tax=Patella vulgata TaxID=6465 RepID=UPI0024A8D6A1|nr:citrate synthase-lysine N-methyltransferase CSKMT, mitochondrial [Patella vulgata]
MLFFGHIGVYRHVSKTYRVIVSCREYSRLTDNDIGKLATRAFWKEKYSRSNLNQSTFDWFVEPDDVIKEIESRILKSGSHKSFRIMDIGCGTSSLALKLYSQVKSPVEIHCVDFIHEALGQQKDWSEQVLTKGHPCTSSHFVMADVCHLPYRDEIFDCVVDKGTIDALVKDKILGEEKCRKMLYEMGRLLNKNGTILQISDEHPEVRQQLLETLAQNNCLKWSSSCISSFGNIEYFMYIGRLKTDLPSGSW